MWTRSTGFGSSSSLPWPVSEKVVGYGRHCRRGHLVADENARAVHGGRYYACRICLRGHENPPPEKKVTLALYLDWMDLKARGIKRKNAIKILEVSQSTLTRTINRYGGGEDSLASQGREV